MEGDIATGQVQPVGSMGEEEQGAPPQPAEVKMTILRGMVGQRVIDRPNATAPLFNGGDPEEDAREVTLMAVSGRWAMVRIPGCMPYTTPLMSLQPKWWPGVAENFVADKNRK